MFDEFVSYTAWQALKLAIRVSKLLSDVSVPSFYPTLFVLVTEVMDTVGRIVYDRILKKCEQEDDGTFVGRLPVGFSSRDVRKDAQVSNRSFLHE